MVEAFIVRRRTRVKGNLSKRRSSDGQIVFSSFSARLPLGRGVDSSELKIVSSSGDPKVSKAISFGVPYVFL